MEFVVRGARDFDEPGVFMAFEESEDELIANVESLGFALDTLVEQNRILLDGVRIERSEIEETGEYDLEGLFVRLGSAIAEVGARRVALDGIDALFAALPSEAIVRAELRRLFRWLKEQGVTAVITGEQGEKTLTRHGSGGVRQRLRDLPGPPHDQPGRDAPPAHRQVSRLSPRDQRIPDLIDESGFQRPADQLGQPEPPRLARARLHRHPETGRHARRQGYYKGSSVLVSGTSGAGKSSVATAFADSICRRGERCLFWSSEESPDQILRNMASIGFDLQPHIDRGLLTFAMPSARPCTDWRIIWSACTDWSSQSVPPRSFSTRSPTSPRSATPRRSRRCSRGSSTS
jgi:circadian clock protein KaiC